MQAIEQKEPAPPPKPKKKKPVRAYSAKPSKDPKQIYVNDQKPKRL